MKRILVVEDDENLREGICYALGKDGYYTAEAGCLADAERLCRTEGKKGSEEGPAEIGLILLDVNLPDGDGFSLLQPDPEEPAFRSGAVSHGPGSGRRCAAGI